jgi:hypothetical protein
MTLTSYDEEDFFAILNYLLLRNHDWWETVLTWSCYSVHCALISSEEKPTVTWWNQEQKFLYFTVSIEEPMPQTHWFQHENLYKFISYMHATDLHHLQETGYGKSSEWMVYRSQICRQQDNIKIKPKISVSLVTLLTKVCEHSDGPTVGGGACTTNSHFRAGY